MMSEGNYKKVQRKSPHRRELGSLRKRPRSRLNGGPYRTGVDEESDTSKSSSEQTTSIWFWVLLNICLASDIIFAIFLALMAAAIGVGLGFAGYHLYARYIKPVQVPEVLQALERIQETLSSVQELLIKQDKLQSVSQENDFSRSKMENELAAQDIKKDLASIKGLLLTLKQFPPPPPSEDELLKSDRDDNSTKSEMVDEAKSMQKSVGEVNVDFTVADMFALCDRLEKIKISNGHC